MIVQTLRARLEHVNHQLLETPRQTHKLQSPRRILSVVSSKVIVPTLSDVITMTTSAFLTYLVGLVSVLHLASSHGLMTNPPQRGALTPDNKFNANASFPGAPADMKAHFPAGDKDDAPGAAARSQMRVANFNWTPFEPLKEDFKWRAGVCGDEIGKEQEHMRGGRFYYDGQITRSYKQGEDIEIEINVVAHHNGFVEIHVCDIAKCGGEISEACFREGHCKPLQRAPNLSCDSGMDLRCAPIDPKYPGRWYLPCTTKPENTQERFGGPKMKFRLPEDLSCQHCVIHWFWSAANTCNPPGVIDFFEGPNGPKTWGDCFGQGGAKGGYSKVQKPCGPDRNPEEYYQCADVAIEPSKAQGKDSEPTLSVPESFPVIEPVLVSAPEADATPVITPLSEFDASPSTGFDEGLLPCADPTVTLPAGSVFKQFSLVADGEVIGSLTDGIVVDVGRYEQVAIEAVTFGEVSDVKFSIDGSLVWTDYQRPYFMFGNKLSVPNYWGDPITNRYFDLVAEADGSSLEARILFTE